MILVDTDLCIFALKGNEVVLRRWLAHPPSQVTISVITEAELRTGVAKSGRVQENLRRLEMFLAPLTRVPFESQDADAYAQVRAALERRGTPIGPLDTLIASQAVARGLHIATHNVREFSRVPGLKIIDWLAP